MRAAAWCTLPEAALASSVCMRPRCVHGRLWLQPPGSKQHPQAQFALRLPAARPAARTSSDAPRRVLDQLRGIFPGVDKAGDLLIVPTCQRAECDLVKTGEVVDNEKDRLLERVRRACALA